MNILEEEIGQRIRALRQARGLTLQELALRAGVSKSYLSRVETSKNAPPVSTLLALAVILGTTVGRLLGEEESRDTISIVKKGARPDVTRSGSSFGYTYSSLIEGHPDKKMEAYVLTLPRDIDKYSLFQHPGEELLYVLSGSVAFTFNDKDYYIEEGDCAFFNSKVSHFGRAVGDKEAQLLAVFLTEPDS